MKRLLSMTLCALLSLALCVPAAADIIWEPDDEFYLMHYDECERVNAVFEAREEITVRKSPEDDAAVHTVAPGERAYISYVWHGAEDWGCFEYGGGWVEMSALRRLYDAATFEAEHESEFTERGGTVPLDGGDPVYIWTFPGSGALEGTLDEPFEGGSMGSEPAYSAVWTDADGREWGRVDYYYGMRGWICLTAPGDGDLPVTAPVYADGGAGAEAPAEAPDEREEDTVSLDEGQSPAPVRTVTLTVCLVMLVSAVTVIIICVGFMRKDGKERKR